MKSDIYGTLLHYLIYVFILGNNVSLDLMLDDILIAFCDFPYLND